jgi:hypothetical protein
MPRIKKGIMLVFIILLLIDLYTCTLPGQEYSIWLRPLQMQVLFLWIYQKKRPFIDNFLLFCPLFLTSIFEHIFYSTGFVNENILLMLLFLKNIFFIIILYRNLNVKPKISKRLYRWIFNYFIAALLFCYFVVGNDNWLYFVGATLSAAVLFFISLRATNVGYFRQLYLGYALIVLAMIFGKILQFDPRWFIEAMTRISLNFGHLLFVAGLAQIKLISEQANISEPQTVKKQ